jgi:beta-glucanase (GH16 family)
MLDLTGYKLTFSDEFNSRSISQNGVGTTWADIRSQWRFDSSSDIGFGHSSFVDPASGYDPFKVQGGALSITAVPDRTASGYPGSWESGLITTQGNFSQTYGYFEMRADLADARGGWDAFWLLPDKAAANPTNLPGWQELDIVEHYGAYNQGTYRWIHTTDPDPNKNPNADLQVFSDNPTQVSGYHTYGMDWQKDKISFYFDGQLMGSRATPSDMHGPMYLLANLATQSDADEAGVPMTMKIDYIRAYSKDPGAVAVIHDSVSAPDDQDPGLYGATAAPVVSAATQTVPATAVSSTPVASPTEVTTPGTTTPVTITTPVATTSEVIAPIAATPEATSSVAITTPVATTSEIIAPIAATPEATSSVAITTPVATTSEVIAPLAATPEATSSVAITIPVATTSEVIAPVAHASEVTTHEASTPAARTPAASTSVANTPEATTSVDQAVEISPAVASTTAASPTVTGEVTAVYRFFDTHTGDHFYTTSTAEKAQIQQTMPWFNYEGTPWAAPVKGADTIDVFRFFDTGTNAHFFTTNAGERDQIIQTTPSYRYEGVAFEAYADASTPGTVTLERFFNTQTGQHHFAGSAEEAAGINHGGAGPGWVDEGRGFTVHLPTDTILFA